MSRWRRSLAVYSDRRVLLILPLGFASGLPLLLTFSTLSAWLATAGVRRGHDWRFRAGRNALRFQVPVVAAYRSIAAPAPAGAAARLGVSIQIALIAAMLALGSCDPKGDLAKMGGLALLVAFLSASQDIVIDAWRVEILTTEQQGPGAGMIQTGYRLAMLVSGAGSLMIAARAGWFAAYATMAALLSVGMLVFLLGPEPPPPGPRDRDRSRGLDAVREWLETAVVGPFADFMRRPGWLAILIFVVGYKVGEAMAGVMAMPLYISLGFSLNEIAAISKLVGFFATVIGALAGGLVAAQFGLVRALIVCGVLQSAGNLFYVLQAMGGHRLDYLALCVAAENVTGAMAGAALVAYLFEPVLSRVHGHSIRAAFLAGRGRADAGGILGRRARRPARMDEVFSAYDRGNPARAVAAGLDRVA